MSILRRLFDSNYHHLSEDRAGEYIALIEARYDKAIEKYGNTLFRKVEFHERYNDALKKQVDLYHFFRNETDYLEGLLEKIKRSEEGINIEEDSESEEDVKDGISVFEKIYEDYAQKLDAYPKIDIHPNASEEIERLLGCMVDFSKNIMGGLRSIASRMEKHSLAKRYIEELYYLMDDFCVMNIRELPLAFKQYLVKVEAARGDDELIELADINILKMAVDLLRKVKDIVNSVDDVFLSRFGNMLVAYAGQNMKLGDFLDEVKVNCRKILEDFRIDEF